MWDVFGANVFVLLVGVVVLVRKADATLVHVHQVALWVSSIVIHVATPDAWNALTLECSEEPKQITAV